MDQQKVQGSEWQGIVSQRVVRQIIISEVTAVVFQGYRKARKI